MANSIRVRHAESADLESVHNLEHLLFDDGFPYFFFRQALDALSNFFLVAEADGGVIGYSLGSMQIGDERGWILGLGVALEFRGKGIGGVLTVDLLKEFEKNGAKEAFLHVAPANTAAVSLYEKVGFKIISTEENYFGAGAHRLIMRRESLPQSYK